MSIVDPQCWERENEQEVKEGGGSVKEWEEGRVGFNGRRGKRTYLPSQAYKAVLPW